MGTITDRKRACVPTRVAHTDTSARWLRSQEGLVTHRYAQHILQDLDRLHVGHVDEEHVATDDDEARLHVAHHL